MGYYHRCICMSDYLITLEVLKFNFFFPPQDSLEFIPKISHSLSKMMTQPSPPQGWVWSPKQTWLHSMLGDSPWSRWSTSLPQKQAYPDSMPASCQTKGIMQIIASAIQNKLLVALFIIKSIWHGCWWGKTLMESVRRLKTNFVKETWRFWIIFLKYSKWHLFSLIRL